VLDKAHLAPGETLLDVGTGDGLIAFGALDRLGPPATTSPRSALWRPGSGRSTSLSSREALIR
jgi:hypothetical protein